MDSYFENPFAVQGSLRRGMVSTAIEKYGMVPELGQASTELGLAYASIGDYANAYRSLKKFADEGMMDSYNLTVYATAAVRTGRLDEAEPALRKALRRYPEQRSFMYTELANVRLARARVEIDRKRAGPAENLISEGEEYIRRTPETGGHAARRDAVLARLLAARGDLCLLEGDRIRAAGYLRRACRINPGDPMTMRWGALAENLERNLSVPR
jgi:tetratricopeptide (TPR) repeat protein